MNASDPNSIPTQSVAPSAIPPITSNPPETLAEPGMGSQSSFNCIGEYVLLGELGHGGMGVVYRAEDPRLKREVAVKVMLPQFAANPHAKARFVREARAQAKVEHEHVAAIYQVNDHDGLPYIVMPLLKGMTLHAALRANPRPPINEVIRIGREVAEGLVAAHEKGLVHRDIKPANIWLEGKKLRVKVLDFGLARATDPDPASDDGPLTHEGAIIGTPAYMSPEQASGQTVDGRTDLWSLGVVLYQMTTGRLPFTGTNTLAVLTALAVESPPAPHENNPHVPVMLSDLVMRLLSKTVAFRPSTAEQVVEELRAIEVGLANAVRVIPLDAPPLVVGANGEDPFAEIDATEPSDGPEATATEVVSNQNVAKRSGLPVWVVVAGLLLATVAIVGIVVSKMGQRPQPELAGVEEASPQPKKAPVQPVPPKPRDPVPQAGGSNLLALIDPGQDRVKGNWERKGAALVGFETDQQAVIEIPYRPADEYDLRVDFTRDSGSGDVSLIVNLMGNPVQFCLGHGGKNFGFAQVSGESKFATGKPLETGLRYTAVVKVRRDRIIAVLDGKQLQEILTDGSNLSVPQDAKLRNGSLLGLSVGSARVTFHQVEVTELTGKGRYIRGDLDRQAAEALLADKALYVTVRLANGKLRGVGSLADKSRQLPDEPFELFGIGWTGPHRRPPDYASRVFLPNLAGLKSLTVLGDGQQMTSWTEDEFLQLATNPFWPKLTVLGAKVELTPKIVAELARCTNLSELSCGASMVGDEELAVIAKLRLNRLTLNDLGKSGRLTGTGWRCLTAYPLNQLHLTAPVGFNAEIAQQVAGIRELTFLSITKAKLGDDELRELSKSQTLEYLHLDRSQFPDASLAHLAALPRLSRLQLTFSTITDDGLKHVGGLKHLQTLGLTDTQVSDEGLEHLKGLQQLRLLPLERTRVTEVGAKKLAASLPNCRIGYSVPGGVRGIDPKNP